MVIVTKPVGCKGQDSSFVPGYGAESSLNSQVMLLLA